MKIENENEIVTSLETLTNKFIEKGLAVEDENIHDIFKWVNLISSVCGIQHSLGIQPRDQVAGPLFDKWYKYLDKNNCHKEY